MSLSKKCRFISDLFRLNNSNFRLNNSNQYQQDIIKSIISCVGRGEFQTGYLVPKEYSEMIDIENWLVSEGFTVNIRNGYFLIYW